MTVPVPASIRNHNPGAMWPGPSSVKFGAADHEQLNDAQRNQIASFPDDISGAAALFDLLNRSYTGMTLEGAITKWSGGNNVDSYLKVIGDQTGLKPTDRLTAAYLRNPKTAVAFAKAMSLHEAGKRYPMSDADWREAHARVYATPTTSGRPKYETKKQFSNSLGDRIAARALSNVGKGEKPGPGNYQHMDDWYAALGLKPREDNATPWCELFAMSMWAQEGAQVAPPSDPNILLARNHANYGQEVEEAADIDPGCALVWPRPEAGPSAGHVGIAVSVDEEKQTVTCVEGNVSDKVTEKTYSFEYINSHCLAIRRPVISKLRPNGTKSVRDTVSDSPSLRMMLNAKIAAGLGILCSFWDSIKAGAEGALGILPEAQQQVSQVLDPAQDLAGRAGIPVAAWVCFSVVAVIVIGLFVRNLKQRQKIDGTMAQEVGFWKVPAPAQ